MYEELEGWQQKYSQLEEEVEVLQQILATAQAPSIEISRVIAVKIKKANKRQVGINELLNKLPSLEAELELRTEEHDTLKAQLQYVKSENIQHGGKDTIPEDTPGSRQSERSSERHRDKSTAVLQEKTEQVLLLKRESNNYRRGWDNQPQRPKTAGRVRHCTYSVNNIKPASLKKRQG